MKYLIFTAAAFLCGAVVFVESSPADEGARPLFNLNLLASGSWEESKTLHNRAEIKLDFLPAGLTLRGEILDRRTLNFGLESIWGDPEKAVTNFLGGLYHKPTGSRLLFGVLDEWGLSARIRNPWIRSPPYPENHKPLMADLKTAASSTKEDEVYLYLSSPFINFSQNLRFRGFASAQTEIDELKPVFSGGLDFSFSKNIGLRLEAFYTGAVLTPTRGSTWFSFPPPLPEREFNLYAAGFLFNSSAFSVSGDWAYSETFAWGTGIYGNLGIMFTPSIRAGNRTRPLSVSLAADGAGGRFIYRDGANHGEGFRAAVKIEWKGARSSLLRLNTVLRGPGFGEDFNRSSTGFYYRFPSAARNSAGFPIRLTRISISADRNANNPQKINDKLTGYIGFSVNLRQIAINTPLGIAVSGSVNGLTASGSVPPPYPVPGQSDWIFNDAGLNLEITWLPRHFQFRSKFGYTFSAKKDDLLDFSFSAAVNFRYGRLSIKAASSDFPEKWDWTVSWRLEKKN
ncbi:MAG: hypothetical protein LBQ89_03940 [Treponema sp.]|jgi:hypothetical protein|nr:hypothetical protein [Treponema sp.]